VARNRALVLERIGAPAASWLRAEHGARVRTIAEPVDDPDADGLVTTVRALAVAGLSADCVLVALADPASGVVAVAHCGRPGLLAGTIAAVVDGCRAAGGVELRAAIGPAICGSCYALPADVVAAVTDVVPEAASRGRDGRPTLDVRAGVRAQLAALGVDVRREVGGCTVEDPALYSYRRDGVTGRLGCLVWRA